MRFMPGFAYARWPSVVVKLRQQFHHFLMLDGGRGFSFIRVIEAEGEEARSYVTGFTKRFACPRTETSRVSHMHEPDRTT